MKFNTENRSKTTTIRYDTRIDFTFAKCRESIKWTQYQREALNKDAVRQTRERSALCSTL